MSVVTVCLGQAGNQVGASFFEALAAEEAGRASGCFFRASSKSALVPRAVLVDTEPKVVQAIVAKPCRVTPQPQPAAAAASMARRRAVAGASAAAASITLRYDRTQTYCRQSGSANNWAFGFRVHGPQCWRRAPVAAAAAAAASTSSYYTSSAGTTGGSADASSASASSVAAAESSASRSTNSSSAMWTESSARVSELVRREVEKCDEFEGFLVLQSAAGGTGSGVGTYATRALRDEYRTAFLANALVWPFQAGEVIVQNYNCALALAHVVKASDAVIMLENDAADAQARGLLKLGSPSFAALNRIIARQVSLFSFIGFQVFVLCE